MIIVHPLDEFLYELFPDIDKDIESLKEALKKFYTIGPFEPRIEISDDMVKITIDGDKIDIEHRKYKQLISLCEASKFEEAKIHAEELISSSPNVSEYHRILGQVYSELGDQEEAINSLIYALRWNPKNEWALLMMGNIFTKFKDDIETALKYYDQVLKVKPNDTITLNNIGANLMQLGKTQEAVSYFEKALVANPDYPNTYYSIALVANKEGDFKKSFDYALRAVEKNNTKDQLYGNSFKLAIKTAGKLKNDINGKQVIDDFISKLTYQSGKKVEVREDPSISTPAKFELAENYDRNFHLVKFKANYPSVEHLVLHELTHLELIIEARKTDQNQLFATNQSLKSNFLFSLEKEVQSLRKKGINEESISRYLTAIFDGINLQAYNTPIDLFIEDRIYNRFKEIRPLQFLSLLALLQEGIDATTRKDIVQNSPIEILSKSKIFNLVNAIHFKTLFHVDLIQEHKPTKRELAQAESFYEEFLEYRKDKSPSEEYELVQHWAEDQNLDGYFELIPETEHKRKTVESVLSEIENDPYGLESDDPSIERKMKKFLHAHSDKDTNTAVAMYMVDAIQFFTKYPKPKIKEIALEIATIGIAGIDPNKDGYSIPSIKGSSFSGYQTLAYYYTSFAIAIPEMLNSLQLPFDKEYELANNFVKL
jgi:tetratricopeptide (TPR) repeat protein